MLVAGGTVLMWGITSLLVAWLAGMEPLLAVLIGAVALAFALAAHKETHRDEVWTVATLLIAASIVAHDLTATPLSRWLGRRTKPQPSRAFQASAS